MTQLGPKRKLRVLVIDDSEASRYALARNLAKSGIEVVEAASGFAGLAQATIGLDLIIVDVRLPDISGFAVTKRLKENSETAHIPVLQISADFINNDPHATQEGAIADGYLAQPVNAVVLIATVNALVRARRAERELEITAKQNVDQLELLRREKILRDTVIATLTHDLRSSIGSAKMAAEALDSEVGEENPHIFTEIVTRNLERALTMIDDLLDANRIKAGLLPELKIDECDLHRIATNVIDDVSVRLRKRILLTGENAIKGHWDCKAIHRIIENLATNAVKYGERSQPIRLSLAKTQSSAIVEITNEGPPIPQADQATLFDLFSRTDSAKKSSESGWGIGLTIVKGLTEAHGGSVRVKSDKKTGTVFTVTLPT